MTGVSGGKVRNYISSPDPRARENGRRCTQMLLCGTGTGVWGFVMSVMGNCPCARPVRGLRGLFQVKRVIGRGE